MKLKSCIAGLMLVMFGLLAAIDAGARCHRWRCRHYHPRRVWVAPAPRVVIAPPTVVFRQPHPHFYNPHHRRAYRMHRRW
jgi:hypothetical protein